LRRLRRVRREDEEREGEGEGGNKGFGEPGNK
jgi:hypothetical protein